MKTHSTIRRPAAARAAIAAVFAKFGTVMATWAVHLPSVQQATGISKAMLGTLLLICGVGGLIGMQLGGALVDHFGGRVIAGTGAAALALALLLPLSATSLLVAVLGTLVLGLAAGITDVSMNAAAVQVEHAYGRPIMASFHAMYSIGNVVGSLISAAGFALSLSVFTTVGVIVAICVATALAAEIVLYRSPVEANTDLSEPAPGPQP